MQEHLAVTGAFVHHEKEVDPDTLEPQIDDLSDLPKNVAESLARHCGIHNRYKTPERTDQPGESPHVWQNQPEVEFVDQ